MDGNLRRAHLKQYGYGDRINWFYVNGGQISVKKYAVSKIPGFM